MEINKKYIIIIFIILLLSASVNTSVARYSPRESVIEGVDSYVNIDDENHLSVNQCFHCQFIDENEIVLSVPYNKNQSIDNLEVEIPGYYKQVDIYEEANNYRIVIHLYEDGNHFNVIQKKAVDIYIKYQVNNAITAYDDVAVIDYTLWDSTIKPHNYSSIFTLPASKDDVIIYNYAEDRVNHEEWLDENIYQVKFDSFHEVKEEILIPRDCLNSTDNIKVIHQDAKEFYKEKYDNHLSKEIQINKSIGIFKDLLIILITVPFIMWILTYQRGNRNNPIIQDDNLDAVDVNYYFNNNVGKINLNGFYSLFLTLIRKKAFLCSYDSDENEIRLNMDKYNQLDNKEKIVFDYVKYLIDNPEKGIDPRVFTSRYTKFKLKDKYTKKVIKQDYITFSEIEYQLKYRSNKDECLRKLEEEYEKACPVNVRKYFNDITYKIMSIYLKVILLGSVLALFVLNHLIDTNLYNIPLYDVRLLVLLLIVIYLIALFRKNMVYGRWTSYGLNEYNAWIKYADKYSKIDELNKESLNLVEMNEDIEYAIALGKTDLNKIRLYFIDNEYMINDFKDKPLLEFIYLNDSIVFDEGFYEATFKSRLFKFLGFFLERNK